MGDEGEEAFRRSMVEQHHYLLALLRYKTNDDGLAEDLLQETYLSFLASRPDRRRFADAAGLRNYLTTIALNKLRDHWRREGGTRRRQAAFRSREEADAWLESLPSAQGDPAGAALDEEEAKRVERTVALAMERLPERRRLALELKFAKNLDNGEIAAKLGLGIKAVESLLFRAKAQFRKEFAILAAEENESVYGCVDYERDGGHGPQKTTR